MEEEPIIVSEKMLPIALKFLIHYLLPDYVAHQFNNSTAMKTLIIEAKKTLKTLDNNLYEVNEKNMLKLYKKMHQIAISDCLMHEVSDGRIEMVVRKDGEIAFLFDDKDKQN